MWNQIWQKVLKMNRLFSMTTYRDSMREKNCVGFKTRSFSWPNSPKLPILKSIGASGNGWQEFLILFFRRRIESKGKNTEWKLSRTYIKTSDPRWACRLKNATITTTLIYWYVLNSIFFKSKPSAIQVLPSGCSILTLWRPVSSSSEQ